MIDIHIILSNWLHIHFEHMYGLTPSSIKPNTNKYYNTYDCCTGWTLWFDLIDKFNQIWKFFEIFHFKNWNFSIHCFQLFNSTFLVHWFKPFPSTINKCQFVFKIFSCWYFAYFNIFEYFHPWAKHYFDWIFFYK